VGQAGKPAGGLERPLHREGRVRRDFKAGDKARLSRHSTMARTGRPAIFFGYF